MIKETRWVGVSDKRFWIIAALLMVIFAVFMAFLFIEAEAIKKNPCSICAEKMGEDVYCTIGNSMERITRTFEVNGNIKDDRY